MQSQEASKKEEPRRYEKILRKVNSRKAFVYFGIVLLLGLVLSGETFETVSAKLDFSSEQLKQVKKEENNLLEQQIETLKGRIEKLEVQNRELADDNIELQNSLKLAASVGTKPQNYTRFNGLSARGSMNRGEYIGKFLGTAYTPSKDECGNDKGITCSGEPIIPGVTVAIDRNYWPFGTVFYIKGLGYAVAMDTGSAVKGKYRFDFAVFNKEFAQKLGSRLWEVYLVKMGNGKVEGIE